MQITELSNILDTKHTASLLVLSRKNVDNDLLKVVKGRYCQNLEVGCEVCSQIEKNSHPEVRCLDKCGIDDIREVVEWASISANYQKICLIRQAQNLTLSASNSLLKVLEEPPNGLVFILSTTNRYLLLQTIISRCQIVNIDTTEENRLPIELLDWLGKATTGKGSTSFDKNLSVDLATALADLSLVLGLILKKKYDYDIFDENITKKLDFFNKNYDKEFLFAMFDKVSEQIKYSKIGLNPDLDLFLELVALQFSNKYKNKKQ